MEQPSKEESKLIWTSLKIAGLLEEMSAILDDNLGSMPKRNMWYDAQDAYNTVREGQHQLAEVLREWIDTGYEAK